MIRTILSSFGRLATGEVVGRVATFALYAYISRRYGLEILGIVALAQTIAAYVAECSDQGLKLIGSRLLARHPALLDFLVPSIVKRRALLTVVAVALGTLYAVIGPIPSAARFCVLLFVWAVIPYAFALDWVAWGLGHFGVLSFWRSGISVIYVALAIAAMQITGHPISSIAGANLVSALAGAAFLLLVCHLRLKGHSDEPSLQLIAAAEKELRPLPVLTLGMSNLLNLVFMNADIVLLGAITTTHEVGRYSAACKPLYIIFTGFWLLTDAVYPHLAKLESGAGFHKALLLALVALAAVASAAALVIAWLAPRLLTLIYGSTLGADGLFRVLLIAMPIDFCFSLLWTVLVSRGQQWPVLVALATAAAANVLSNLAFIPRFQASAAAWITVGSYALLFSILLVFVLRNKVLSEPATVNPNEPGVAWA